MRITTPKSKKTSWLNYFIPPARTPERDDKRALTLLRFQTQRIEGMDIKTWRDAIEAATSAQIQRWYHLQDLYDVILLDGMLSGVLEKRTLNIVLSELSFNDAQGNPIEAVMKVFKGSQWLEFLSLVIGAKYRGYSALQFTQGKQFAFEPIPHRHVLPSGVGVLLRNYTDNKGIAFDDETFAGTMCLINTKSLGLLAGVAQYAIMKFNATADNAQYLEQYAMPIKAMTYNGNDPNTKDQVKAIFEEAGSGLSLTLPEGMDAKLITGSNSSSNDAFGQFIDRMNKEISIAVLGQTMTTEDGSSLAQARVHKEVNDQIDTADRVWVTAWLNEQFVKYMPLWGVNPAGGEWVFSEDAGETLEQQINNDMLLKALIPDADPAYFADKYGIPRITVAPTMGV